MQDKVESVSQIEAGGENHCWLCNITWFELKSVNVDSLLEKLRVNVVVSLAPGSPCASTPQMTYFCPRSIWRYTGPSSLMFGHQAFIPCRRPNSGRKSDPLFELAVIWSSGIIFNSSRIPTLVSLHVPVNKVRRLWINNNSNNNIIITIIIIIAIIIITIIIIIIIIITQSGSNQKTSGPHINIYRIKKITVSHTKPLKIKT